MGRLRRWADVGTLPTTAAGAETAVVILVVGLRVGTLVQMAPSAASGVAASPSPTLYALTWALAAVTSIGVCVRVLRSRAAPDGGLVAVDVAVGLALLVAGTVTVVPEARLGTWEGFQPAYALSVLLSASAVHRGAAWFGALAVVMTGCVMYLEDALPVVGLPSVAGHLLTYVVLGVVGRGAVLYVRRMAEDADRVRLLAAELARRDEERRAQAVMHNGAAVMSLLAQPDLTPELRTHLLQQAGAEAVHLRTYLRGGPGRGGAPGSSLPEALAASCAQFPDLPVEHALELATPVTLPVEHQSALQRALTSMLLNVRAHADARLVVVDLEVSGPDGQQTWLLTVHDDGRGFEVGPGSFGVGLGHLVVGELSRLGMAVDITSRPGEGTTIRVEGTVAGRTEVTVPVAWGRRS